MKNKEELLKALDYIKENNCSLKQFYNCDTCPQNRFVSDNFITLCSYKLNYDYIKEFIIEKTENERFN